MTVKGNGRLKRCLSCCAINYNHSTLPITGGAEDCPPFATLVVGHRKHLLPVEKKKMKDCSLFAIFAAAT